ncbi:MAG: DUF192 domain-containing protein [Gammaproteobacteria bacterium]|nr:DUF192 domain-containing protein [Gammaproteobacteria bacterium]MDP7418267.1 DUF192 domain-containing protein [Gammaproteobacteria bacterium]
MRRWGLLCCALLVSLATVAQAAKPKYYLADFTITTAIIETSALSCLAISIYLADSRQQQAQGLMHIEQLDKNEGMLFRYSEPAIITMWMKNTYIPLDMAFIRQDGRVAAIARHTTPMSTARITSREQVTMVLELNAGFTEEQSFEVDDRLLTIN